jgi:hypothetical protein
MCYARQSALLLYLALGLCGRAAHADEEYNLPDPPGAMVFDQVPARVVPAPNEKIPASCDARYRAGMESSFRQAWAECRQIGAAPPSDCQRALFERCTQMAADLQKMEAQSCTAMLGESDAIAGFQRVDSQKTSQASNADLNARAYVATQRVIQGLEKSRAQLAQHQKRGTGTMNAYLCANSTEAKKYGNSETIVARAMSAAQSHLASTIAAKKAAAAQFAANSGRSQTNLAQLVSEAPAIVAAPKAAAPNTTIYTGTVVETVIGPSAATSTVVTTSVSQPVSVLTVTNTAPSPAPPPYIPPDYSSSDHQINWVPILAVGIPAAVLTALVVSKLSKNKIGGGPDASGGDNGGGGVSPGSDDGSTMPGSVNRNPAPATYPGGGDLAALKITTDPSFTDQQRGIIAAAVTKIPACYRYKLQGLYIQNKRLPTRSIGCVAGEFIFGGGTVYLSPSCAMAIGITVHEFFHVLGNRNNNELHQKWKPVYNAGCPVTKYAATNFYEAFAETGRLLEYPDSSAESKRPGACVNNQIQGLGQIMNNCPQPGQQ